MNVTATIAEQVLDLLAHNERVTIAPVHPVAVTRESIAYRLYRLARHRQTPLWA